MRYHVLAADYDGTLAHHGRIDDATWSALRRLRDSGRKIVMVTGRELDELLSIVPHPEVFERIVAENGAVLYDPRTREARVACLPPSPLFVAELVRRGVERVSVGRAIVATWEPYEDTVLHVIHDLGLELQVIFNKGAVMVLPTGINKATGLAEALADLGMSKHNVVAVGDAENDHALIESAECGVAVANALPVLKQHADLVTANHHGAGVAELIDRLLADDLASIPLERHRILLGKCDDRTITLDPYRSNVLVCGTSGSGKSTLATGLLERLCKRHYQFAIIDPEGDYEAIEFAVALGSAQRSPLPAEVLDVLKLPSDNVTVNLLEVAVDHRPEYYAKLLPSLSDLRTRTGRPHWLVVDEAHHLLSAAWKLADEMAHRPHGTVYITVHPRRLARSVLATINTLISVGEHVDQAVRELCAALGVPLPTLPSTTNLPPSQALYWEVGSPETLVIQTERPKTERARHLRKYMEGNLGRSRAFYFRGPEGKLNLGAPNLMLFVHIAFGVDDETWLYHARKHDYSHWLRTQVKDHDLADEIERIEHHPYPSRAMVRAAIEKRYTLPADQPSGLIDPEEPRIETIP
jgi:HAD superfamily hydrolase (TIGR01484 family)